MTSSLNSNCNNSNLSKFCLLLKGFCILFPGTYVIRDTSDSCITAVNNICGSRPASLSNFHLASNKLHSILALSCSFAQDCWPFSQSRESRSIVLLHMLTPTNNHKHSWSARFGCLNVDQGVAVWKLSRFFPLVLWVDGATLQKLNALDLDNKQLEPVPILARKAPAKSPEDLELERILLPQLLHQIEAGMAGWRFNSQNGATAGPDPSYEDHKRWAYTCLRL